MTRTAWLLTPLCAALLGSSDAPVAIERLRESCDVYERRPYASEADACRAYVQGFLDGGRHEIVGAAEASDEESFTERALRVRLGRLRLRARQPQGHELCVPTPAPLDDIIRDFRRALGERSDEAIRNPATVLTGVLRQRFPCPD